MCIGLCTHLQCRPPPSLLDVLDSGCSPDVCHTQLLRLCPHHSWFLLMYIKWTGRAFLGQLTKERPLASENMGAVFFMRVTWKITQDLVETSNWNPVGEIRFSLQKANKKNAIYQSKKAVLSKEGAMELRILAFLFSNWIAGICALLMVMFKLLRAQNSPWALC